MAHTTLGTLGTVTDLSHQYGAPAYQTRVTFAMFGLDFEAIHFVRSAATGHAVDSVELYIRHPSSWMTDYVGNIDAKNPGPAGRRALHLINVSEQGSISDDTAARFALLEVA